MDEFDAAWAKKLDEAWDLIDRMLPYVKGQLDTHSVNSMDLLGDIEEKRKSRGPS